MRVNVALFALVTVTAQTAPLFAGELDFTDLRYVLLL